MIYSTAKIIIPTGIVVVVVVNACRFWVSNKNNLTK